MKKLIISIFLITLLLNLINWFFLKFPSININSLKDRFSNINFTSPWNNFGWGIFWLNTKSLSWNTNIILWSKTKICSKLVRWLYYNNQRWKRVRPLDEESLDLLKNMNSSYNELQISWWLYTTCDSRFSIFGMITYNWKWNKSYIIAWTKLDYQTNRYQSDFSNSFQYFDGKIPLWYIWDSYGWIWFVGWNLSWNEALINFLNNWWSINSWFKYSWDQIVSNNPGREFSINKTWDTALDTLRNIIIQWTIGLSKSLTDNERLSLMWNLQTKTVILNWPSINSSNIINQAKNSSQTLCKWKSRLNSTTLPSDNQKILCYQNTNLIINLSETTKYENKTIIVQSGNITLVWWMRSDYPSMDLFVDKWILYVNSNNSDLENFDAQWFPSDINAINSWIYLKWNFVINGLIIWWTPWYQTWINHKLHLQWKLTSLNIPVSPNQWRISQIENLLWSSDYQGWINLQNVFTRVCNLNGIWTDGTSCENGNNISITPIVIIDGNYLSNLIK